MNAAMPLPCETKTAQVAFKRELPRKGDYLLVQAKTRLTEHGEVRYTGAQASYQRIVAVYLDGDVKVQSGDVWSVRKSGNSTSGWEAVNYLIESTYVGEGS